MKQTTFAFLLGLDNDIMKLGSSLQNFDLSPGYYSSIDDLLHNFKTNYDKWAIAFAKEIDDHIASEEENLQIASKVSEENREQFIQQVTTALDRLKGYKNKDLLNGLKIEYDNIRKRVVLNVDPGVISDLEFSSHLNYMLGFKQPPWGTHNVRRNNGLFVADYPINFNAGANSLYVYTDVVQPNIVSNKMARLLRIVNGTGDYGTYISKAYTKPYYMPVSCNTVNSIEIEIKDEMDRNIRFTYGITIVLLHFQKKRSFPLL